MGFPRLKLLLLFAVFTAACAGRQKPETAASEAAPAASAVEPPSLRDLCREGEPVEHDLLDNSRRILAETFCGATLWFDGLFGQPDVENAREVSGRVELSTVYTEADGAQPKARLRLKYELPNLERRVNLFLGRDDRDEFVQGRQEGFAIRSSVFGVETQDRWLAGLGYSPPGRWRERLDFRAGARLSSSPEAFVQGRLRRNVFLGTRSVWRLRETVFYENRDGFGSTSSADFDYVLRRRALLFHWGTVGTVSEATDGMDWRSATVLYQNLGSRTALGYEIFLRGSTGGVEVREYGARGIFRRALNREWLYGELIGGYTWPRESAGEPRKGSALFGFGLELLFGRDPY
ncbi:MAG TPA: hypothetical protein VHC97_05375 [Thermoanaerobaculia bacterium]|jgi:hypothetical protein|nr:hypothetical protein [Thermoanaerobaculia bacterium]